MTRLLIIADDFTGSLDTGVQFAKRGINTLVTVLRDQAVDLTADCQALVVNTESRHVPPEEAYRKVRAVTESALAAGFTHIYKKMDSTLRGNIGSELAAVLDALGDESETIWREINFVPAFPKSGRFTKQGLQYVGEMLLHETAFANDPFNPIRVSSVKEIIAEQTDIPVDNVFIDQYDQLANERKASKTIRVVDAVSDDDLQDIGQALKTAGKLQLLAGCAGFAEYLPELLGLEASAPPVQKPEGATLLVSGSVNPMSIKQVQYAFTNCGYADSQLTVEQKINPYHLDLTWETRLAQQLRETGRAAIWSKRAESAADDAAARAEQLGIATEDLAALIASNIGTIVKRTLDHMNREADAFEIDFSPGAAELTTESAQTGRVGTLIVFGGDTLLGIADKIGSHLMRPIREIVPGVALAQFVDERLKLYVITKAGGFGGEDVVGKIEEFLGSI